MIEEKIKEILQNLSEKERLVITLKYYEELSEKEIGYILKVSEDEIKEIDEKIRLKIKDIN